MCCVPIGACGIPSSTCCALSVDGTKIACTLLADTYGVGYRALTGKVDKYTKNNLIGQEQAQLTQAGMDAVTAAKQAKSDTEAVLKLNKACPCNCDANTAYIWYIALAVLALVVFWVFTNHAARRIVGA